jgi:hypothetical protein
VEVDQVELQAQLILQVQAMSLRLVRHKVMMVEMLNPDLQTQIEVEVEEELVQQAQQ